MKLRSLASAILSGLLVLGTPTLASSVTLSAEVGGAAVAVRGNPASVRSPVQTGWFFTGGAWYYANAQGVTQHSRWLKDAGRWYYLSSSGAMATGWLKDGGSWYHLAANGAMAIGWVFTGGQWYYLSSSGAMATGWLKDGGNWYHLAPSGAMTAGWLQAGGQWYYLASSGEMVRGERLIDARFSTFDSSGAWLGYTPTDFVAINLATLNVRTGPGTSYGTLGTASRGQVFHRFASMNGWHKINFEGRTGWVSGSYTTTAAQSSPGWTAWPSSRPSPTASRVHVLNGNIPNEMCVIPFMPTHKIHCRAVNDLAALNVAYKARFGTNLPIDDWQYATFRSYADQVTVKNTIFTAFTATPGTSPHGWGLAIDFLEGSAYGYGSTIHNWLIANGPTYGWKLMPWHQQTGSLKEYWHFDHAR
ncbi:MAG: SH3 domain-containing protein [Ruaniaceae bacterium]|nr:SH3 domain-containing protein [Ruaniaceae bacterium]